MTFEDEVRAWLPLEVHRAESLNPFVLLGGDEQQWSLFVGSPFTLSRPGTAPLDSESASDDEIEQAIASLGGLSLVKASISESLVDPTFVFSDGSSIAIDSDSDFDPWVLQLGGTQLVLVGGHRPD